MDYAKGASVRNILKGAGAWRLADKALRIVSPQLGSVVNQHGDPIFPRHGYSNVGKRVGVELACDYRPHVGGRVVEQRPVERSVSNTVQHSNGSRLSTSVFEGAHREIYVPVPIQIGSCHVECTGSHLIRASQSKRGIPVVEIYIDGAASRITRKAQGQINFPVVIVIGCGDVIRKGGDLEGCHRGEGAIAPAEQNSYGCIVLVRHSYIEIAIAIEVSECDSGNS